MEKFKVGETVIYDGQYLAIIKECESGNSGYLIIVTGDDGDTFATLAHSHSLEKIIERI